MKFSSTVTSSRRKCRKVGNKIGWAGGGGECESAARTHLF